jgi:hypothetical protein
LDRLEHKGFIESEWGESDNNSKAKFYRLTPLESVNWGSKPKVGSDMGT